MIRLNLLPDVKHESRELQQAHHVVTRVAQIVVLVTVGATVLLALWVYGVQALHKKILSDSINDRYHKLRAVKDVDTYATIQNQLSALTPLHDNKNLTSRLFDYLPGLNSGVTLKKVSFRDADQSLVFEGEALDYRRLVIFRDTLQNTQLLYKTAGSKQLSLPFITSASIDKSAVHPRDISTYVSFTVTARYQEIAFKAAAKQPLLSVTKKETTPSVIAAPLVSGGVQP